MKKEKSTNKIRNLINRKTILFSLILITIILLIPIIGASFYTNPSADDYTYGLRTMNALSNGGIIELIKEIGNTVKDNYFSWQGTFSAIVLFSLNPSIWGTQIYFLTTIIILVAFFFSIYYLFSIVINKVLKVDKIITWIAILVFYLLCIETIPDKTQGLYWWNGASYYMLFFSMQLIEIALLIKRYVLLHKTKLNSTLVCILTIIISGGNFITALQLLIILAFLNLYLVIVKKDKSATLPFALAIIGFLISALAPGNAVRASGVVGMNPIKAIIMSFISSINKIIEWSTPLNLVIITIISLLLITSYKNIKFNFKYPLVFILFLYCIFSAEFTPSLYAQSTIGEGRALNIMYISYLLFLLATIYYLNGNIRLKCLKEKIFTTNALTNTTKILKEAIYIYIIFFVLLINIFTNNKQNMTSYVTYRILANGEAKTYYNEYQERLKILKDDKIKDVEFERFSVYPYPIVYAEYSEDKYSWLNTPTADIYHKNYVVLKKEK